MDGNRKKRIGKAALPILAIPPALCLLSILDNMIVNGYNFPKDGLEEVCYGSVDFHGDPGPYRLEGFWYSAPPLPRYSGNPASSVRVEPAVCGVFPAWHSDGSFRMLVARPYLGWHPR